ncbi:MAG TPA: 6,7-dimethyl-8-ribityllumazine synthase [Chthoniobacterales bacterium]|jgi:6,7-dimethyl-8-ribityllumazine synthase|nr:6,7-dimethyl-8-ribityllumazine synthase [Chthoniobacterales bacterium]
MSKAAPSRPRASGRNRQFAIVASLFNRPYTQGLVDHAIAELRALSPSADISVHHVPGAFEIPVVVREIALKKNTHAILALGVILQGKTSHAEHLARSVTDALQKIAIDHGIPVINAVLSLETETQARERCLGSKINRGTEAARAAVTVGELLADLRGK